MKELRNYIRAIGIIVFAMWGISVANQQTAMAAPASGRFVALKGHTCSVATTGKYALYTKPETMKGARLVASKEKMSQFGRYTRSDANFYATRIMNRPNRGSTYFFQAYGYRVMTNGDIYYRVVSMNKKYRGYVYGGKTLGQFSKGIVAAQTTRRVSQYNFANEPVGIVTPGILWNVVPYTQYPTKKLGQMADTPITTLPHLAKFKIKRAAQRVREGDQYYLVVSEDNHHLKGWVNRQYIVSYNEVLGNFGVDQD